MRPVHPGEFLREELDALGLSANPLSKASAMRSSGCGGKLDMSWCRSGYGRNASTRLSDVRTEVRLHSLRLLSLRRIDGFRSFENRPPADVVLAPVHR